MRKILAVSGGIDSVVMLHLLKDEAEAPLVVHFDHGIRPNSSADALFVEELAKSYGLEYVVKRAKLGANCSEAEARDARYAFFRELAEKHHGVICVAHHADDVIESITINLLRGTGWRGLAPMNAPRIERPLKQWRKKEIYRYATEYQLHFRQDQTNTEDSYLRNRVRSALMELPESKKQDLLKLYERQSAILEEIKQLLATICGDSNRYSKELIMGDPELAQEYLRYILSRWEISLTRPQLERCVDAIQGYPAGKKYSLDRTHFLSVGKFSFSVI